MKLLLNENIGRRVAQALRSDGHDAVWIGDDFAATEDALVLRKARLESRVLVTKDKDFGDLAFQQGAAHTGIILLRLSDEGATPTLATLRATIAILSRQTPPYFAVASEAGLRVRASPKP